MNQALTVQEMNKRLEELIIEFLTEHGGFARGRSVYGHVKMADVIVKYEKVLGRLRVLKKRGVIKVAKMPHIHDDDDSVTYLNLYKMNTKVSD